MTADVLTWSKRNPHRRALRTLYGVSCAACRKREPKRIATVLLPMQVCYCGYKDPRTKLTKAQKVALLKEQKA